MTFAEFVAALFILAGFVALMFAIIGGAAWALVVFCPIDADDEEDDDGSS